MDRGAWWAMVHGVTKLDTPERLSMQQDCNVSVSKTLYRKVSLIVSPNFG